ncbi:MAG: adenylyl-sulfate kinase, partial [Acidobacteriaceae bacterium]|nr:adenylyl-sulfate kinase [Acidobacteriaceae bacterium]
MSVLPGFDSHCSTLGTEAGPAFEGDVAWIRAASRDWPSFTIEGGSLASLELMLRGALGSRCEFMTSAENDSIRRAERLPDGTPWLAPILLPMSRRFASTLKSCEFLALRDSEGVMLAALRIHEVWNNSKSDAASDSFGPSAFVAGRVIGLRQPIHYSFRPYRQTTTDLKTELKIDELQRPIAFVTTRPIHRATFNTLMQISRQTGSRVLIIGVVPVGFEDRPLHSTVRCWLHAVEQSQGSMHLALWPIPDASSEQGLFLAAQIALTTGCKSLFAESCSEFVCRNVSSLFDLTVKKLPSEHPGNGDPRDVHAEIVDRLREGVRVPPSLTFPAVARELSLLHGTAAPQGAAVFFTGLSGSGKSTIANALQEMLLARTTRPITLLDGDVVRQHLSPELGFSRKDREVNLTRIGFVAMEIAKHGGITICAPIAPYDDVRTHVRNMV